MGMDWLWISAVSLVGVFILALCWLFFKDYTCCPCRRTRPLPPPDVEAPRQVAFDGLPPPRPQQPHRYYRPHVAPPQPPLQLPTVLPQSRPLPAYNFRGIVNASEVVRTNNNIPELDLHGLKVWEAKQVTQMFLKQSRGRCRSVRIVTGRGLHAPGGIPRIKPEVENLLDGYSFREINKGGCLVVDL